MEIIKNKKFLICIITGVFFIIALFSLISIFSVKNIDVSFTVTEKTQSQTTVISDKLQSYKNKSLIFLNTESIVDEIQTNPYLEVTSVKKIFPNTVSIEVKERVECFYFESGERVFIFDSNGFCLSEQNAEYVSSGRLIKLRLVNVSATKVEVGSYMEISAEGSLSEALKMAEAANLSDCISVITLYGKSGYAVFNTHTGVRIDVSKYAVDNGVEMMERAFVEYDSASDYIRTYNRIIAVRLDSGEIRLMWTSEITDYE